MTKKNTGGQHSDDNRANQLNPNNDAYWRSRGDDGRPESETSQPVPHPPPDSSQGSQTNKGS